MSDSRIGPGDWVRCVDDRPHRTLRWRCPLSKGQLYTVRALYHDDGLLLKEARWAEGDIGFLAERFVVVRPPFEP